jgi:hypothetical protein
MFSVQSKAIIDDNFLYLAYAIIIIMIIMIILPKPAAHSHKRSILIIGEMLFMPKKERGLRLLSFFSMSTN